VTVSTDTEYYPFSKASLPMKCATIKTKPIIHCKEKQV
jgi:hypothetical protein